MYFCALEAMQNAAKHAGTGASVTVRVVEVAEGLAFEVVDDGAGFDPGAGRRGAGFVNMSDRLGALGGTVRIDSAPGRGTRVAGTVPLAREREPAAPIGGNGASRSSNGEEPADETRRRLRA